MATSQNGYVANVRSLVSTRTVPGSSVRLSVRNGPAGDLLLEVARYFDQHVENIDTARGGIPDDWGYAERPIRGSSTKLSNHASGTAIDLNALKHPLGARNTFTNQQKAVMHGFLAKLDGCVRWGEDYLVRKDGMHFEIMKSEVACSAALAKIRAATIPKHEAGKRLLRDGSRGTDVALVQRKLDLADDGIFGPKTKAAVIAYQKARGLPTTGEVWKRTWAALLGTAPVAQRRWKVGERTLKVTNPRQTGDDVAWVQSHFRITQDGVYGVKTRAAVRRFQERHNARVAKAGKKVDGLGRIEAKGVVGDRTIHLFKQLK